MDYKHSYAIRFLIFVQRNFIFNKGHYRRKGNFEKTQKINQKQLIEIFDSQDFFRLESYNKGIKCNSVCSSCSKK